jgi:H+/Cl- antiporter ClcA
LDRWLPSFIRSCEIVVNLEKLLVGSLYTRVAAGVFGLLAGLGLVLVWSGFDEGHHWIRISAIVCALLAGIAGIYSCRAVFSWWMRFAKVLNGVVTTVVFGLCYLVLVPFFVPLIWALDPLGLRGGSKPASFWHQRRSTPVDVDTLRRMG